jgi:hypothetical protein
MKLDVNSEMKEKLALTSPTSGDHSVDIVRLWTKGSEFVCLCVCTRAPSSYLFKLAYITGVNSVKYKHGYLIWFKNVLC